MPSECLICNENSGVKLTCQHQVCLKCIVNLISSEPSKCPVCRQEIEITEILKLNPCARCQNLDTDYCDSCANFLCQSCWPLIHSFKPLNLHQKGTFEPKLELRQDILVKLELGFQNLKKIDEDLVKLREESLSKTPSVRQETRHEVRKVFNEARLKLEAQEQTIEQYLENQTQGKIESCLEQKLQFKAYLEDGKAKLFEHLESELQMKEGPTYNSDLDYHLIINPVTLPELISIPNQEVLITDSFGIQRWFLGTKLHRSGNQPAVIYPEGRLEYYFEGCLHRDDGPAMISANGDQFFYQKGLLHRDNDLPAVIYANGGQSWYQYGKLHRDSDLPAYITDKGDKSWYKYGLLHRDSNLPASESVNGSRSYYLWGKCHRTDGPAQINNKGKQTWFLNGVIHRDFDEPAVIHPNGQRDWYFQGKLYKTITSNKEECYYSNGLLHRDDDLPAHIMADGQKRYYKNGKLHREGEKPAIMYSDGKMEYYIEGIKQNK